MTSLGCNRFASLSDLERIKIVKDREFSKIEEDLKDLEDYLQIWKLWEIFGKDL